MNSQESDLLKLFTIWNREKHDAMISIIGFADLLLDNKTGELSNQQQRFIRREDFPTTIKALLLDSSSIRIQIHSSLILEPEHISVASITYPGNCFDLAGRILQEHSSILELFPVSYSEGTFALFEFTLPVWKGR